MNAPLKLWAIKTCSRKLWLLKSQHRWDLILKWSANCAIGLWDCDFSWNLTLLHIKVDIGTMPLLAATNAWSRAWAVQAVSSAGGSWLQGSGPPLAQAWLLRSLSGPHSVTGNGLEASGLPSSLLPDAHGGSSLGSSTGSVPSLPSCFLFVSFRQ